MAKIVFYPGTTNKLLACGSNLREKCCCHNITTSVYPDNSGTVSGAGCYNNGTRVTLVASPKKGWVFDRWSDGSSAGASRTITVSGPAEYTAFFRERTACDDECDSTSYKVYIKSICFRGCTCHIAHLNFYVNFEFTGGRVKESNGTYWIDETCGVVAASTNINYGDPGSGMQCIHSAKCSKLPGTVCNSTVEACAGMLGYVITKGPGIGFITVDGGNHCSCSGRNQWDAAFEYSIDADRRSGSRGIIFPNGKRTLLYNSGSTVTLSFVVR